MRFIITNIILVLLLLTTGLEEAEAQVRRVSPNTDLNSVKAAIAAANPYDTLIVEAGTYKEYDIIIDKPLTIKGEGSPVLDGEKNGFVVIIRSDNVTLKDLSVINSGKSFMEDYAGILIEESSNVLVENIDLAENFFGIYLSQVSDSRIMNNTLKASGKRETQSGNGIHLWYSKGIEISGNTVKGHRDGIYFEFVEDLTIHDNLSEGNLRYGQHFMFSDRCVFTGNTFRNNGAGVAVMYTDEVTMTGNQFLDNWGSAAYGLLMKEIRKSEVYDNVFANNSVGMYMEASSRNRIKRNDFIGNGWALKVMANSMDNQFVQNNFIENSFEVSTNSRQNFNIFNKNYWSQYKGYDLDRDGTGDVPHHPVRLFSLLVEQQPEMLALMRSMLIGILDTAERIMPVLTPENLVDKKPQMMRIQ